MSLHQLIKMPKMVRVGLNQTHTLTLKEPAKSNPKLRIPGQLHTLAENVTLTRVCEVGLGFVAWNSIWRITRVRVKYGVRVMLTLTHEFRVYLSEPSSC